MPLPSQTPALPKPSQEAGSITVFALIAMVSMIGIGGLAVDTMNYEGQRVSAQDALDRCSLMSALAQNRIDGGSSTDMTAAEIASDCMVKSATGSEGLGAPVVTAGSSERTVSLSGTFTFDGMFPMAIGANGVAEKSFSLTSSSHQKLPNVEISLAVDINHKVFWDSAKGPLKTFLNTIAAPDTANKVSVSIIPFNKNVKLGTATMGRFNTINQPPQDSRAQRTCLVLPDAMKDDLAIDYSAPYSWAWPVYLGGATPLTGVDITSPFKQGLAYLHKIQPVANQATQSGFQETSRGNCMLHAFNSNHALFGVQVARPVSAGTASPINSKLDTIVPASHTDINNANSTEALKWSLAALDTSFRPFFTDQIGAGVSPAPMAGRPLNYGAEDTMKVLIFITNNVFRMPSGAITSVDNSTTTAEQVREIRPEWLSDQLSPIWRTPEAETNTQSIRYSIRHDNVTGANKYWVTRNYKYVTAADDAKFVSGPYQHPGGAPAVQQTWRQVMEAMTVQYLIRDLYMLPMSYAGILPSNPNFRFDAMVDKFTYVATETNVIRAQFAAMCAAAKEQGVLVYMMIAPGAVTRGGSTQLVQDHNAAANLALPVYKDCATSPAHVFTVGTTTLAPALRMIASNIAQLTLTQ
jgi:hypothetical protein